MFKLILFIAFIINSFSVLVPLDKQLVSIGDLTNYSFKVYFSNRIYDFQQQSYKSRLGYMS